MRNPARAPTPPQRPQRFICECEHKDHFDNGPKHLYGCDLEVVEPVDTPFGIYYVCPACRATCCKLDDYPRFPQDTPGLDQQGPDSYYESDDFVRFA